MSLEGAIAAHRFGLGARPGEIEAASPSPRSWLLRQLDSPAEQPTPLDGGAPLSSGGELVSELLAFRKRIRRMRIARGENRRCTDGWLSGRCQDVLQGACTAIYSGDVGALCVGIHYAASVHRAPRMVLEQPFRRVGEQPRRDYPWWAALNAKSSDPNVTGKFEDMLLAATRHPAMQIYLNNAQSIGPDSIAGHSSGRGLNENLGRELMELHTLGVDGGYTQADVICARQGYSRAGVSTARVERPDFATTLRATSRATSCCAAKPIPPAKKRASRR